MANCFHCGKPLDASCKPGRGDECPSCGSGVKACLNCRFYNRGAYNGCAEPSAERVVDKDRANFCEFFEFGNAGADAPAEDPLKKLKDLFK